MSAARTKKTKTPESVPGEGDPDRKRVLNVLAQRRYRQRRRARIAALEAQVGGPAPSVDLPEAPEGHHSYSTCPDVTGSDLAQVEGTVTQTPPINFDSLFDFDHESSEANFNFPALLDPLPSSPRSSPLQFPLTSDGSLLDVPILHALRAFTTVSIAFGVVPHVWNPSYLHVVSPSIPAVAALPANLQPVPAQLSIPHHPLLDLLPWPNVREKLICMLAMPSTLRPPVAQEDDDDDDRCEISKVRDAANDSGPFLGGIKQSKAIVQLVHDLDGVEEGAGIQVHGNTTTWGEGSELMEECWEIGNLFYRNWWWCLDQKIVEVSNRRRRERGLSRLRMVA